MSKSIKELTSEEKKGLKQLIGSVVITGVLGLLGVILKNSYIYALQGLGLVLTVISLFKMLSLTKLDKE